MKRRITVMFYTGPPKGIIDHVISGTFWDYVRLSIRLMRSRRYM